MTNSILYAYKYVGLYFLTLILLSGCTKTLIKEVPVEVKVPVAVSCPIVRINTVSRPPEAAIDLINQNSPMDKDVDYWKAWVLQLKAYIIGLELANTSLESALKVCMGEDQNAA